MSRNKKLYYSAGLISIIMLPIMCLLTINYNDAYKMYYSMNCQIWDGMESTANFKNNVEYLNTKKFTIVNLTGNSYSDKIKIEEALNAIRKLVSSKDSINGFKFHFGQKSEYWAFVDVLEILQIGGAYNYFYYKNDIWVANPKIVKPKKFEDKIRMIICGTGILAQQQEKLDNNESKIFWQNIKVNYLKSIELSKKYYLPIIAYVLMLFFTFKRIFNKKKGNR